MCFSVISTDTHYGQCKVKIMKINEKDATVL